MLTCLVPFRVWHYSVWRLAGPVPLKVQHTTWTSSCSSERNYIPQCFGAHTGRVVELERIDRGGVRLATMKMEKTKKLCQNEIPL